MTRFALAVIITIASQVTTVDHVVDLVVASRQLAAAPETVSPSEAIDLTVRPFNRHNRPAAIPFAVSNLVFDRERYLLGDDFIYEVTLRYTGQQPMAFPTSVDGNQFTKSHKGLRVARLSIRLNDDVLQAQSVGGQRLYGSPEVRDSLLMLKRNESVKFLVPSKWILSSVPPSLPRIWSRSITPSCEVSLYFTETDYLPNTSSDNPTIVLERQRR